MDRLFRKFGLYWKIGKILTGEMKGLGDPHNDELDGQCQEDEAHDASEDLLPGVTQYPSSSLVTSHFH